MHGMSEQSESTAAITRRAYVFHNKGSNDMVWRFEIYISRGGETSDRVKRHQGGMI